MALRGSHIQSAFVRQLGVIQAEKYLSPQMGVLYLANTGITDPSLMSGRVFGTIVNGKESLEASILSVVETQFHQGTLEMVEHLEAGKYSIQLNLARAFRPVRTMKAEDAPLNRPFNPKEYSFMTVDPLERFLTQVHDGIHFDFLFNMYPFAPYQFLIIPDLLAGHNQLLNPDDPYTVNILETLWNMVQNIGETEAGIRIGYNAQGAHASVNHLHFQGFFQKSSWRPSPFQGTTWIPADRTPVKNLLNLIRALHRLYDEATPGEKPSYNFLMTPTGIAFFHRRHQSHEDYVKNVGLPPFEQEPFTTGLAFFELATGEIVCPHLAAYAELERMKAKAEEKDQPEKEVDRVFESAVLKPAIDLSSYLD